MDVLQRITEEFQLREDYAKNIITLLDDGNTIPFIARYRKELTGHIDDQVLRNLSDRLNYLRNLETRKEEVKKAIDEQGKLTDEIVESLQKAETLTEVEDVYRPYKQKKKTRAIIAIEKGLEPLAEIILAQSLTTDSIDEICKPYLDEEKGVLTTEDAVQGAKDIIAEKVSDDAELRKKLRGIFLKHAEISSKMAKGKAEEEGAGTYSMYADYSESVAEIKSHRILAINRGEDEGFLKVKIEVDDEFAVRVCSVGYVKNGSITTSIVQDAVKDGYERLIYPSIEREIRNYLTDNANEQAIKMFGVNLKPLLMQPPLRGKITMGFDPGIRTGCKIAVVDETGKVLSKDVVYATLPDEKKVQEAKDKLKKMISDYKVDVISIGNGTASKESEILIAGLIKEIDRPVSYAVVSEAGASVYSASKLGAEEFPDFDVSERSAVSIARRLQDPLAELVKIDPKSIGVGQYQHDMPESRLDEVLKGVCEDCVNAVGVDLNTASPSLLSYVSGLNGGIAKSVVAYREANGKFRNRKELLKVPKLGQKAFTQSAGFLRIVDGESVLDNTGVHPESYDGTRKMLDIFGYTDADVKDGKLQELPQKVKAYGVEKLSKETALGVDTLNDNVQELIKRGRDIRDSLPQTVLRSDLLSINDLKAGMIVKGTVRNVIDFGAFVDLGVHQDGLIHVSEISDGYIKHPSDVLKVGQVVNVKILSVDLQKNRIALTLKNMDKNKN